MCQNTKIHPFKNVKKMGRRFIHGSSELFKTAPPPVLPNNFDNCVYFWSGDLRDEIQFKVLTFHSLFRLFLQVESTFDFEQIAKLSCKP